MAIAGAAHGLRRRGTFNVEVKLEGDWIKYDDLMNRLGPIGLLVYKEAQEEFAEEYRLKVRENIANGGKRFGFRGLKESYRKSKTSRGGPDRVLYWGGTMYNSVKVVKTRRGRIGVGIPKGISRPNYRGEGSKGNRLTVSEYANILEHGTFGGLKIPARPVFSKTFTESYGGMGGKIGMKGFMSANVYRGLRQRGINVTRFK